MRNTAPKKSRQVAEFSQRGNGCERCDAEARPAMEEGQQLGGSKTDEPASERAGEVMMKKEEEKQQQKKGSRLSAALRLSPWMDDNKVDE